MAKEKSNLQTPGVVFQPRVSFAMQRGIDRLVSAIRPTLGPIHRNVLIEKESKLGRPELLDDGAIIARRIIQLRDRDEDMGAMYLRQVLWSLREKVGDGTATAAVLFQTIYNQGLRYLAAGGNAMRLRQALEAAEDVVQAELEKQVLFLNGKQQFARLAETICYDPPLAKMLGEIFDIIGPYGQLDIRSGRSRELEREYVEGMYWNGGLFSRGMLPDPLVGRVQLENTHILCTDLEIKEPQDLLPVLEMAASARLQSLLLVAATLSERALAVLLTNREKIQVIAVRAPALDAITRSEGLEDLALLTGGRVFFQAAGDSLKSVKLTDLGGARRAWADTDQFGIFGGKGDPRRLRQHINQLRSGFARVNEPNDRLRFQKRIGKLMGGSAILWVGANTPLAIEMRKALAERTAEAMRGAIRDGVLPGGGVSLLACKPTLGERQRSAMDMDERMACHILFRAMESPIRVLLENAGQEADEVLAQIRMMAPSCGFDVIKRQVVDMGMAGIYDSASVVKQAVRSALRGAALALSVDVLIHLRNPPSAHHKT